MIKYLGAAAAALSLSALSPGALAQAGDWSMPAIGTDAYRAQATVALLGGQLDPDLAGADADTLLGVELSLNCPLIQPPSNRIRQQLSLTRFDDQGVEITSLELNPHYLMPLGNGLELGFGPGFGVMNVDAAGSSETLFGLQAGASLHYRRDGFFVGAEARYQWTTEEDFGAGDTDIDNSRLLLKVGMDI